MNVGRVKGNVQELQLDNSKSSNIPTVCCPRKNLCVGRFRLHSQPMARPEACYLHIGLEHMVWGISIAWSAGSSEVFEFHTIFWGFLTLPKAVPQVDFFFSLIWTWPFHLAAILRPSSCPILSDLSLAYWDPKMKGSLLGKWDFGSKSIHRIQSGYKWLEASRRKEREPEEKTVRIVLCC